MFTSLAASLLAAHIAVASSTNMYSTSSIELFAHSAAIAYDLPEIDFVETLRCESGFVYNVRGDKGLARGVAQIRSDYWPNVSDDMADNPYFSILFMAEAWKDGHKSWWSCFKIVHLAFTKPMID